MTVTHLAVAQHLMAAQLCCLGGARAMQLLGQRPVGAGGQQGAVLAKIVSSTVGSRCRQGYTSMAAASLVRMTRLVIHQTDGLSQVTSEGARTCNQWTAIGMVMQ